MSRVNKNTFRKLEIYKFYFSLFFGESRSRFSLFI